MRWQPKKQHLKRLQTLLQKQKVNPVKSLTAIHLRGWGPKPGNGNMPWKHGHLNLVEGLGQHWQNILSKSSGGMILKPRLIERTCWRTTGVQTNQHRLDSLWIQQWMDRHDNDTLGTHHPAILHLKSEPSSLDQMLVPNTPPRQTTHTRQLRSI